MAHKKTSVASPSDRKSSGSSATPSSRTSTTQGTPSSGTGKGVSVGSRQFQGRMPANPASAGSKAYERLMPQASSLSSAGALAALGIRSTLTTKSQTTLPRGVRDALHVGPGDELVYEIQGEVATIRRAPVTGDDNEDPVLLGFLDLLERDLAQHPGRARALPAALLTRMRRLAEAAGAVGRDEPIDGTVVL